MRFLLKRYIYGVSVRRRLLLLLPVALFAYLSLTALAPESYTVKQRVRISEDAPLAIPSSPVAVQTVRQLASQPGNLFTSSLALSDLERKYRQKGIHELDQATLTGMVRDDMRLASSSKDHFIISYRGDNPEIGQTLVIYFAQQLLERALEGHRRATRLGQASQQAIPPSQLEEQPIVETNRELWDNSRTRGGLLTLFLATLVVMILFAVLEWSDPAFKSERQVGRYLGIPVLGSLPDLGEIAGRIGTGNDLQ